MITNTKPVIVTGGYDNFLVFWNALEARPIKSVPHPQSQINCLSAAVDQRVVASGGYSTIRSYDVEYCSFENPQPITSYEGHKGNVTALGHDKDGRFMFSVPIIHSFESSIHSSGSNVIELTFVGCSVGEDGTARIWDLRGSSEQYLVQNEDPIHCGCLHPINNREVFIGDESGRVLVWDLLMNKISSITEVSVNSPIQTIGVSPKSPNLIAVANLNGLLALYNKLPSSSLTSSFILPSDASSSTANQKQSSLTLMQSIDHHDGRYVTRIHFSPSDSIIATSSSDGIGIWSIFSPPFSSFSIGLGRTMRPSSTSVITDRQSPWQGTSAAEPLESTHLQPPSSSSNYLPADIYANYPTVTHIQNVHGGSFAVNNYQSSNVASAVTGPWSSGRSQTKSPSLPASHPKRDSNMIRTRMLHGHTRWVWDITFSLDGMYLVSASSDCTAKLWDICTSTEILTYAGGHSKPITAIVLLDSMDSSSPSHVTDTDSESNHSTLLPNHHSSTVCTRSKPFGEGHE